MLLHYEADGSAVVEAADGATLNVPFGTQATMDAAIAAFRAAHPDQTRAAPPAPPALVPKYMIVDRLQAAGKLEQGRALLDASDLYTRERWNTKDAILPDDPTAMGLVAALGLDPAVILALPPPPTTAQLLAEDPTNAIPDDIQAQGWWARTMGWLNT